MSIFKNKMTTEEAFRGVKMTPHWPPRDTDTFKTAEMMAGDKNSDVPFAASAAEDYRPGWYDSPRNRMNVEHAPRPRRGHDV